MVQYVRYSKCPFVAACRYRIRLSKNTTRPADLQRFYIGTCLRGRLAPEVGARLPRESSTGAFEPNIGKRKKALCDGILKMAVLKATMKIVPKRRDRG